MDDSQERLEISHSDTVLCSRTEYNFDIISV